MRLQGDPKRSSRETVNLIPLSNLSSIDTFSLFKSNLPVPLLSSGGGVLLSDLALNLLVYLVSLDGGFTLSLLGLPFLFLVFYQVRTFTSIRQFRF